MALFKTMKKTVDRHYDKLAAADCNTCHVGTWVVYRENHLMQQSGGNSMTRFFKRFSGTRKEKINDAPRITEAVRSECEREQCKILIVCKGSTFSQEIADYAVKMARRTRSALVALNIDESGRDHDGFKAQAERNIEYFSCKAADAGLSFSHEVRHGDEETVVARMHEKDSRFKYVMDDSAAVCRNRNIIPVYTRATLQAK